jgi:hypothetical protein
MPTRPNIRVAAKFLALALVCFMVSARVTSIILWQGGLDDLDVIITKVRKAAADARVNVLFVGSSHVEYGVNPEAFDRAMVRHGLDFHSYNLGTAGMGLLETINQLKEYFQRRPCCVKYVVFEPDFVSQILRAPATLRAIRFSNIQNAMANYEFMEHYTRQPAPAIPRQRYVRDLAISVLRHYTNLGLIHAFFDNTLQNYAIQKDIGGYDVENKLKQNFSEDRKTRQDYLQFVDQLSKAQLSHAWEDPGLISNYQFAVFLSEVRYLRNRGAEVIVLRPPQSIFPEFTESFVTKLRLLCGDRLRLFDYGSPLEHPDLFAIENRTDNDHLNVPGAILLAQKLADRLAGNIESGNLPAIDGPVCPGASR